MKEIKVTCIIFFFIVGFSSALYAMTAEKKDSATLRNIVKLELVPLYYDFFDYRDQRRFGIEFEKNISKKSFAAIDVDFGLYDRFTFIKYYDFFNQSQGLFWIKQNVTIKGFHLAPAFYYLFLQSKLKPLQGVYAGVIFDFHYYQKNLEYFNSQTLENYNRKYHQSGLGIGINAGIKYNVSPRFMIEIKTSVLAKVYRKISIQNVNEIKPLNAQWADSKYNFWWVSTIKFGYAF